MTMPTSTEASSSTSAPPLGKFLASNDKATRDQAVAALRAFLVSSPAALSAQETTKLWKGIFYCYWHSDKPLVQQALSSELASIPLAMPDAQRAMAFVRGFWEMVGREWNGIDRLRMDKYYMLVRKFINGGFRLLSREDWDEHLVGQWNDMLGGKGGPLDPTDPRIPQSLAYHLADVYLEELEKVVADTPSAPAGPAPPPLPLLAAPFLHLASLHPSKPTFDRLLSALFAPLFSALSNPLVEASQYPQLMAAIAGGGADADADTEAEAGPGEGAEGKEDGRRECKKELLGKWFACASREETREVNRRKMYRVWREEMAGLEEQPAGEAVE